MPCSSAGLTPSLEFLLSRSDFCTLKAMKMSNGSTIRLTPEQGRRVQAVIRGGAYDSVEEVVEAALTAVEQRTVPGFTGTRRSLTLCWPKGRCLSNSQRKNSGKL